MSIKFNKNFFSDSFRDWMSPWTKGGTVSYHLLPSVRRFFTHQRWEKFLLLIRAEENQFPPWNIREPCTQDRKRTRYFYTTSRAREEGERTFLHLSYEVDNKWSRWLRPLASFAAHADSRREPTLHKQVAHTVCITMTGVNERVYRWVGNE